MGNEISKEQLYIYMGALLGHQDKDLNKTVSQAIDISVALMGDYIAGRLVPADMGGTEVPKPAETPVEAPWAADEYMTPPDTVNKEDE